MSNNKPKEIKFTYKKTPSYRTYNVDGIFGGVTTRNKIFIEFFSEKFEAPESITQEVLENGNLGKEIMKERSNSILREVESGIYIDVPTARAFVEWLNTKINDYEKLTKKGK